MVPLAVLRLRVPLLALLAVAVATVAVPAPADARAKRVKGSCARSVSDAAPTVGTAVRLTGTVRPAARRSVRLQRQEGRRWVTVMSRRAVRRGRFSFTLPNAKPGTVVLRVVAGARGRFRAVRCASIVLRVQPGRDVAAQPLPQDPPPTGAPPGATPTSPPPPPRDEVPTEPGPGNSFRAVLGVASDQTADPAHVDAIRHEIEVVNAWFATQTDGNVQPRWMRDGSGAPIVEVVRLAHTAAEYQQGGLDMAREDVFAASPRAAPTQATVTWMDVVGDSGCGVTSHNPTFIWLPEATCDIHPSSTSTWPYGSTYLLGHEVTHGFGAVDPCAPGSDGSGHVVNDARDVIYAGTDARQWDAITLDPGRDDYYGSGACGDIKGSLFWTRTSDPAS